MLTREYGLFVCHMANPKATVFDQVDEVKNI
jgi:hypothetical protein